MAVLLQDRHAEAVEGTDIAGVIIAGQLMYPLPHLIGGLIRKSDAQNVAGKNSQVIHQPGKPVRQRPGLAGACARNHADIALGGGYRRELRFI